MKDEDKFEAAHQEIADAHTGATITFGTHAGSGHRWLRVAVPHEEVDPSDPVGKPLVVTKTSTVTFGPDGHALKIQPHPAVVPEVTADESPREIEEGWADRDDEGSGVDRRSSTVPAGHVDKEVKRGKK